MTILSAIQRFVSLGAVGADAPACCGLATRRGSEPNPCVSPYIKSGGWPSQPASGKASLSMSFAAAGP